MKPEAIDDRVWDEIYEVYVKDKFGLGVQEHFREVNPAALEEVTAVMLESVRKGLWEASPEQVADIADPRAPASCATIRPCRTTSPPHCLRPRPQSTVGLSGR